MRAVIFANGILEDEQAALALIHPSDTIIAADGGASHCRTLGITPNVIIGDLDSLSDQDVAYWRERNVEFIEHDQRKDETDLELALLLAQGWNCSEALVLGALGNRWDQTFANILLPAHPLLSELNVTFWHAGLWLYLIRQERVIYGKPGQTVSLIPLAGDAQGVTTTGLEWPLKDEILAFGATRGVSNVLLGESATIRLRSGLLLCMVFDLPSDELFSDTIKGEKK